MERVANKFRGCLVGALMGDCLGAPFEGESKPVALTLLNKYFQKLNNPTTKVPYMKYTDDTAMTRCVAQSFIEKHDYDAKDMAKRFVKEFYSDPRRGYGANVVDVFAGLRVSKVEDPYGPAKQQFGGAGSWGNGAAMRVAPVALFAFNNPTKMIDIAQQSARITHAHRHGYNGSILQCLAIKEALDSDPDKPLNATEFLTKLKKHMKQLESDSEDTFLEGEKINSKAYTTKLDYIEKLLKLDKSERKENWVDERHIDQQAVTLLGNDLLAVESVPAAIFSVIRAQEDIKNIEADNAFQRCIQYAISLGGDTDTIASMAGAIAGAHLGYNASPKNLHRHCEGIDVSVKLADELFDILEK